MTSKEEIEKAMQMADLAKYPLIAYVNPDEPQETKDMIKELKENCGIKEVLDNVAVEPGQVLIVKRTVIEFIDPPEPLEPNFENATTCNERCGDMVKRTVEEQIKHDRESLNKMLDELLGKENAKR